MTDKTLILIRHAPHGTSFAREGIEAALVGGAMGMAVDIVFAGDGVFCLLPDQSAGALGQKGTLPMIKALPMYDIETIFVDRVALQQRGLEVSALAVDVIECELASVTASYRQIVSF
ncbi:sulfurtransferase complex subunit TusC [Larsenimonas salina]|uniref:sulfurtransferase complex subunit TusC n=1 Tax=Larsenimonas salina TaxID=1295565 RepID=UPI0020737652|nr:sulfurtransferase complex subunit TusC [Larsenimonas salina]MCM5703509.1 sulfurtransferase complex subunit TusC [Larsenimonas salina]